MTEDRRRLKRPRTHSSGSANRVPLVPVWSKPAALRALRATLVAPALFALTFKGMGNLQVATFAAFGAFATLVMASFGGTRKDKLIAHLGLAVIGSVALSIGTLVSGTAWLAALVSIPVAFAIFFAGVIGPNAAAGISAALLSYVLPVASAGGAATIPDRLAGWWMAAAAGTVAVLLMSPRSAGDRLRAAATGLASALADVVDSMLAGQPADDGRQVAIAAKHDLMNTFTATPYRPTGLATPDQGLASVVQLLEWCSALVCETIDGHLDFSAAGQANRDLLRASSGVLRDIAALLSGRPAEPDFGGLEQARAASSAQLHEMAKADGDLRAAAAHTAHAQAIAVATRTAAADSLIASRQADPETIAEERREWYGGVARQARPRTAGLAGAMGIISRHASVRSVWFLNSLRGAAAIALAVAVADLSGVQHGFWVVLGTMSVLRTSASATGATALRALAGTVIGFAIGGALLLAIGTGQTALWVALPVAILIAAYSPGTAPFAVGQAAFTITVVVLFNLLLPVGWRVGVLRIEDVAIGCAVSLVVGVLFWPRGTSGVVGDDLADAFRRGGEYLTQSVDWAVGARPIAPDAGPAAVTAGIRLDDALRGFLAEQGSKRVSKEDLWVLVMATMRLRLTANMLAGLHLSHAPNDNGVPDDGASLRRLAEDLAGFYGQVAVRVGRPGRTSDGPWRSPDGVAAPSDPRNGGDAGPDLHHPRLLWVHEHLKHLRERAPGIAGPAEHIAQMRQRPWWR